MYPIFEPHGASNSGLLTLSKGKITDSLRRKLPISESFSKILDLDRCYVISRVPLDNGKELVVINVHLSAYGGSEEIHEQQMKMLFSDMAAEYEKGNYCICGGDFNKDLLGDSSQYFHVPAEDYGWAKPLPEGLLDKYAISLAAPLDEEHPVPSCRNADGPYRVGQFLVTIDGFLVSDNVEALDARVVDTSFANSDHNPVELDFRLIP